MLSLSSHLAATVPTPAGASPSPGSSAVQAALTGVTQHCHPYRHREHDVAGRMWFSGNLCWLDTVPLTARVPKWANLTPVSGHSGAQAGPGRLAEQQQRQLHGQPAGAPDEHLPGQDPAKCLPAAPHDVSHQSQGLGMLASLHDANGKLACFLAFLINMYKQRQDS